MSTNAFNPPAPELAVQNYFGLVQSIAGKIKRRVPAHIEVDDLVQTGMIGLLEASSRYDAARAVEFASYANSRITGAILDELRRFDTCSRSDRRTARLLEESRRKLRASTGQEPDATEIARAAGVSLEEYNRTMQQLESSKRPTVQASQDSGVTDEIDNLPSSDETPFQIYSRRERWRRMKSCIEQLKPAQRDVLIMYYFKEMGLKEIGHQLGVGEARVSQIHQEALRMLRRKAENEERRKTVRPARVQ